MIDHDSSQKIDMSAPELMPPGLAKPFPPRTVKRCLLLESKAFSRYRDSLWILMVPCCSLPVLFCVSYVLTTAYRDCRRCLFLCDFLVHPGQIREVVIAVVTAGCRNHCPRSFLQRVHLRKAPELHKGGTRAIVAS